MEIWRTQNSQDNSGKEKQHEVLTLLDCKAYSETVIKTSWCWYKNRRIDQWDRIEIPAEYFTSMVKWFLTQVPKITQWRKNNIFNRRCWDNWISTCKRIKLYPFLITYIKINSKWIKNFNVKLSKSLRGNIGVNLHVLGLGNGFFDMTSNTYATKGK